MVYTLINIIIIIIIIIIILFFSFFKSVQSWPIVGTFQQEISGMFAKKTGVPDIDEIFWVCEQRFLSAKLFGNCRNLGDGNMLHTILLRLMKKSHTHIGGIKVGK